MWAFECESQHGQCSHPEWYVHLLKSLTIHDEVDDDYPESASTSDLLFSDPEGGRFREISISGINMKAKDDDFNAITLLWLFFLPR